MFKKGIGTESETVPSEFTTNWVLTLFYFFNRTKSDFWFFGQRLVGAKFKHPEGSE